MADTVQRGRDIKPQLSPKDMIGSDAASSPADSFSRSSAACDAATTAGDTELEKR